MDKYLDSFNKQPLAVKAAAIALLVAAITGLNWYLWVDKLDVQIKGQTNKVATLKKDLAEKTAAANNLNELILEMEQLETRFAEALTELPEGKDIDELLAQFHDIGRQVGLQIDKVEPSAEKADPSAPFVSALPVKMSVEGTYHEVALFLQEVSRLKRIVNVSNVKFSSPKLQGGSSFPATNTTTVRAAGLAPVVAGASQELATPAAGLTAESSVTTLRGDKVLVKTEFVATAYRFVAVTDAPQGKGKGKKLAGPRK